MEQRVWFERRFDPGMPPEAFPGIVERLRGTPARLEERLRRRDPQALSRAPSGKWCTLEHAGHLGDLERLWAGRLDDLLAGAAELRPADLDNRATHEAGHASADPALLLERFRRRREAFVRRLDGLADTELLRTARHPRLQQPMSAVDLAFFVAEHDDHHLAAIGGLLATTASTSPDDGDPRHPIGPFSPRRRTLTPEERGLLIARIAEHPARMRAAVTGLGDEQLDTPYRDGGWTLRQVVHHVVDSHLNAYVRCKLAVTEETPRITTYEQQLWAELPDARGAPVETSLRILEPLHERWVDFLRALEPADFARTLDHPELGRVSVDFIVELYGWHCPHHEGHVTRLRERMGW